MNLYGRLAVRFLLQIGALLVLLWCVVAAVFVWFEAGRAPARAGVPSPAVLLQGIEQATSIEDGRVAVAAGALAAVEQGGGWLQVLDADGNVVYSFHAPAGVPAHYPPGLLVYDKSDPQAFGYRIATWYGSVGGQSLTWLYGVPPTGAGQGRKTYVYVLSLVGGSLAVAILAALVFGRQLGRPLLHMLEWLQGLSRGSYAEPPDPRGVPRSRTSDGELRRPYRVYREVIAALERLAESLRQGDRERERLEETREEWLTGISHDLRTPLSSVKGYADMLAAPAYSWSEEEARGFARTIAEKAAYMDGLIEDLGLTFRLRNRALPLQPCPVDVVELARRAAIDVVNGPASGRQSVEFHSAQESVVYPLDAHWFRRALDNLVANAALHNPEGTTVAVSVDPMPDGGAGYSGVRIRIADDGAGMDRETVEHLFDRYHRGTNTSEAHARGSGLGASIAKQLIEAHGGRVSVDSAVGRGTRLTIELPPRS